MRMRNRMLVSITGVLVVSMTAAACSKNNNSGNGGSGAALTGAGATFPQPIYTQWFSDFDTLTGEQINYQAIGSGGGVTQFTGRTVDFGASDAPLVAAEVAALPAAAVEIPTV